MNITAARIESNIFPGTKISRDKAKELFGFCYISLGRTSRPDMRHGNKDLFFLQIPWHAYTLFPRIEKIMAKCHGVWFVEKLALPYVNWNIEKIHGTRSDVERHISENYYTPERAATLISEEAERLEADISKRRSLWSRYFRNPVEKFLLKLAVRQAIEIVHRVDFQHRIEDLSDTVFLPISELFEPGHELTFINTNSRLGFRVEHRRIEKISAISDDLGKIFYDVGFPAGQLVQWTGGSFERFNGCLVFRNRAEARAYCEYLEKMARRAVSECSETVPEPA